MNNGIKFCQNCGNIIDVNAVVCPYCGVQVGNMNGNNIIINNSATATANANASITAPINNPRMRNKWVALLLCIFLGVFGAHKFYEGKTGMGILYLCTGGLFTIGWIVDIIVLLFKPNPYYV